LEGADAFQNRALEMITSPTTLEAFDISKEPESVRQLHGPFTHYLQARRLVEAGVSVVTLSSLSDNWDTHGNNFETLRTTLPRWDQAVSALITDLYEHGLDQDVVVMISGEMRRTLGSRASADEQAQLAALQRRGCAARPAGRPSPCRSPADQWGLGRTRAEGR
jgi:hypothetical protein